MAERDGSRPGVVDFAGLLANLDRQQGLYDALLVLSEREREAIGLGDLAELARIIAAKERLVAEALALEAQRQSACERWARALDLAGAPTLGELRQRAPDLVIARRLDAAAVALSERVLRLRHLNALNARLIAQVQAATLPITEQVLRHTQHPLYDCRGTTTSDNRPSIILDYRA